MIWRGWACFCLLSGAVVAPLFLEVFAGGTWLRFMALPLRYGWLLLLAFPLLRERWLSPRGTSVSLVLFALILSAVTFFDLLGHGSVHPGWFLGLEWWQRPIYPWIDLLPRWYLRDRPGYLWMVAAWNVVEAAGGGWLLWRQGDPTASPNAAAHPNGMAP